MKDLIIVGAGGFGREAVSLIERINAVKPTWNILGFINDVPDALEGKKCPYPIIGTIQDWIPGNNQYYVMGISSPQGKEKVSTMLKLRGCKFVTLISPTAIINSGATIGEGCVITGYSSVGSDAIIGNFVNIAGSMVGQDAVIGDFCTTTGFANLTDAVLGKRVFVGSHAVILNKLKIGDDAYVCAGSIVFNNVKPGRKVFGNPAKKFEI